MNTPAPGLRFFFGKVFPMVFVTTGALVLGLGWRSLSRARESATWPVATGVVRRAAVEYRDSSDGGGTYHAEVLYEFAVDGVTYSGNRVSYGDYGSSRPAHAQRLVNAYPEGQTVEVRYSPVNPELSVLRPGAGIMAWVFPAIGLVFLGVGLALLVCLPRWLRSPEPGTGGGTPAPSERRPRPLGGL